MPNILPILFEEKKPAKLVKRYIKLVITHLPKTIKNPNIFDVKSVIIEHSKTSDK